MKKRIGILLCLLVLFACVVALADTMAIDANLNTWVVSDDGVLTISGSGEMGRRPSSIQSKDVEKVIIGNGISSISDSAFYYFDYLSSVSIPNSVTQIGEYAFYHCSALRDCILPDSIESIGKCAFKFCEGLTDITLPGSITKIGVSAFSYCTSLKKIVIPDKVTTIYSETFKSCSALSSVTIPNSVTQIFDNAFADCRALKEVTLSEYVTFIGPGAFDSRSFVLGAVCLRVPEGSYAKEWAINNDCFRETYKTGEDPTPKTEVTSIIVKGVNYKLSEKSKTATATGPESKTATSLTIQSSVKANGKTYKVTAIKDKAFKGMSSLKKVTIGKYVKSIGKSAFQDCKKLKTIEIKTSKLTSSNVKSKAFKGIYSKVTIKCPKGVKESYKEWLPTKGVPKKAKIK